MPTYENPVTDAAEAYEALRGLAHATRSWDEPADTYRVIGEVVAGIRCLGQVLDQLAGVHLRHEDGVSTDDGNQTAGAVAALSAADGFHQAAVLLDQAHDQLSAAFVQSGKIVWHPQSAADVERWISVVFLQGDEADRPLRILGELGHVDAVDFLAQWDYGDETTDAAMENGYVYDEPPAGQYDKVMHSGDYALVVNAQLGHVSLLRRHTSPEPEEVVTPGPVQDGPELLVSYSSPSAPNPAVAPRQAQGSWFEPAAITTLKQSGRLSL